MKCYYIPIVIFQNLIKKSKSLFYSNNYSIINDKNPIKIITIIFFTSSGFSMKEFMFKNIYKLNQCMSISVLIEQIFAVAHFKQHKNKSETENHSSHA